MIPMYKSVDEHFIVVMYTHMSAIINRIFFVDQISDIHTQVISIRIRFRLSESNIHLFFSFYFCFIFVLALVCYALQ